MRQTAGRCLLLQLGQRGVNIFPGDLAFRLAKNIANADRSPFDTLRRTLHKVRSVILRLYLSRHRCRYGVPAKRRGYPAHDRGDDVLTGLFLLRRQRRRLFSIQAIQQIVEDNARGRPSGACPTALTLSRSAGARNRPLPPLSSLLPLPPPEL